MNLAQQIPATGVNLSHLFAMPLPHHLHPANTELQTVRKVVEKFLHDDGKEETEERRREIIDLVRARGQISYADAASVFCVSLKTASDTIRMMVTSNQLVRVDGSSPWRFEVPGNVSP